MPDGYKSGYDDWLTWPYLFSDYLYFLEPSWDRKRLIIVREGMATTMMMWGLRTNHQIKSEEEGSFSEELAFE